MRRTTDGKPWNLALPYSDRGDLWGCVNGVTYLSDSRILLRLDVATVSDQPEAECQTFNHKPARAMVDVACEFHPELWVKLSRSVPLRQDEDGTGYLYVDMLGRSLDVIYFLWLVEVFGIPEAAVLSADPGKPIYFRFEGGLAVLMPVVNEPDEAPSTAAHKAG